MKYLTLFLILLTGCQSMHKIKETVLHSTSLGNQVEVGEVKIAEAVGGQLVVIKQSANGLPESRNKEVILNAAEDAQRILGPVSFETQTQFEKLATQLLSENDATRRSGEMERGRLAGQVQSLKAEVDALKQAHKDALAQERAEADAAIKRAQLEGEQKVKRMVAMIGFGVSLLCFLAAGAMVAFSASIPMVGPKAALGTGIAGIIAASTTVAFMQLLSHPNVIWWGMGIFGVVLAAVAGIMYSNHSHHVEALTNVK